MSVRIYRELTSYWEGGVGTDVIEVFAAATRERFPHQLHTVWPARALSDEAEPLMTRRDEQDGGLLALFELEAGIAYVNLRAGSAYGFAAAATPAAADAVLAELRALVPLAEPPSADVVPVTFWALSSNGPMSVRRELEAPGWDAIASNYPDSTARQLERLMSDRFRPGVGGQLILWHGSAGTGKTTALRALARQWRDWCEAHYIADPEKFFGERADYMLQVLLGHDFVSEGEEDKWRLLILEDTGELLQADARAQTGQALARFLNAVDGLIGQGLRILILVTTNEKVDRLHAAVARPGRCAAQVEYESFAVHEAIEWLTAHGIQDAPELESSNTLADLYARVEGFEGAEQRRAVGFVS